jgi:ABC-type spermidine/putrescine transport system permease subunit I
MVGNLVATQILAAQNLPIGAAMAIVLIFMLGLVVAAGAAVLLGLKGLLRVARGPAI